LFHSLLADVGEIIGVEARQLEGEVAVAHLGMGKDHRFLRDIDPGDGIQGVVVRAPAVAVLGGGQVPHVVEMIQRRIGVMLPGGLGTVTQFHRRLGKYT
jgi:hypothetical protein